MQNTKNYNIGLDIGVGSVGWCVTDSNSNIFKKGNKNMWGARIFEEANTAETTRNFRGNRRRINRRKERINILQSLMLEDIEKEYPNFLPMLRETSLVKQDKQISSSIDGRKYNLFSDNKMTDKEYYNKFKTIYDLRKYLIYTEEKVDIRLVYLAIHHIIKYRGNFLHEGDFSENTKEINENFQVILDYLRENYDIELIVEKEEFFEILQKKNMTKTAKKEKLITCFEFQKQDKTVITNIINSIVGSSFKLDKIFGSLELNEIKISFSSDIENEEEILTKLGEYSEIYENLKNIYSWYILQDMLNGEKYISEAFIKKYNKYAEDLNKLKRVYKKYFPTEYKEMFRKEGTNNYVAYNGKGCPKCKPEVFFKYLKNKIQRLSEECPEKNYILEEIENDNFLKKINTTDNGAIPYQLHRRELKQILENQSKYYKTLSENSEEILKLLEFRIPYYVGPLSKEEKRSKWSWVIRKKQEPIRPWNFDDVIDVNATAEQFIKRMTNNCTYILSASVIPKQSILYSRFCVLNELNNIRNDNHHLAKDIKLKAIEVLFKQKKKVTITMLIDFLKHEGQKIGIITGLPDGVNFTSNMASYIDMKNIFGKIDESNIEQIEKIIYWITIFEDKKILKSKIQKTYSNITEKQLENLLKLKYTGWSRLSKELISGLKSYDGDTIIEKLEKTPLNFMQIINEKDFGFDKQLEKLMPEVSEKIKYSDIEKIQTSPANKRAIWQTICIIEEIIKIMKKEPQNIYIEFARNEDKKKMKDNRVKQLLKKYEDIENQLNYMKEYQHKVYEELKQHQSESTLSEKLYLYFIQNGRCMYSGKPLDINKLEFYEIDHIIPQSYIKDNSLDNKVLVLREENQRKKDNLLLEDRIINNMMEWWKSLLEKGLITQNKYFKLTKRKMLETDSEKEKFIHRQLVETRQITKHVTNLLIKTYKDTDIYALRSELTTSFREKYKIYKNRNVNNYHHAHDAYILSIIGNIVKESPKAEKFKYGEYVKKYFENKKSKKKYGLVFESISEYIDIDKAKKCLNYKDCFISRMLQEETGEFYSQTLYSPKDKNKTLSIPLKTNKSIEKYGGYSGENKAYSTIFSYNYKGKEEYQLIGIPIKTSYDIKAGRETIENYIKNFSCLKDIEYSNFRIIKRKILKYQEYLDENNEPMILCSDKEIRSAKELLVDKNMAEQIYLMNSDEKKLDDNEKQKINYDYMFEYLVEKLKQEYKIFYTTYLKVIDKKEYFKELEKQQKKSVINGLIDLMEKGQGNLKDIGLGDREGRKSGQKFNTKKLLNMIFIDKSVTGMYERRYKINGMENSCSK